MPAAARYSRGGPRSVSPRPSTNGSTRDPHLRRKPSARFGYAVSASPRATQGRPESHGIRRSWHRLWHSPAGGTVLRLRCGRVASIRWSFVRSAIEEFRRAPFQKRGALFRRICRRLGDRHGAILQFDRRFQAGRILVEPEGLLGQPNPDRYIDHDGLRQLQRVVHERSILDGSEYEPDTLRFIGEHRAGGQEEFGGALRTDGARQHVAD